ncbi:MAG: hypothetical protein Kow0067_09670 [Coriobacteriia bacterium]
MTSDENKRQARSFEPPPWEKEAFDRFRRERAEREKDAELEAALESIRSPEAAQAEAPETPAAEPLEASTVLSAVPSDIEERADAMLIELRAEEPEVRTDWKGVSLWVSALLVIAGLGFVIWSGILFARSGGAGGEGAAMATFGSLLVMIWGLMLLGFAILLWRKVMR